MASHLSNLQSFLPPLPTSPLTPSQPLTTSDDNDYLAELTRQMTHYMLHDHNDEAHSKPCSVPASLSNRNMYSWVDLFAVSPQSTLRLPSSLSYCNKKASVPVPGAEGDPSWDTQPAYEPRLTEISDKKEPVQTMWCNDRSHDLNPGLRWKQTCVNDGNRTKESSRHRGKSGRRRTHAKNNQGEYYVGLSLPKDGKATGTGVFLPKTAGNQGKEEEEEEGGGRKPRGCSTSTVLIPARVAQALMVHFSNTSHHRQSQSSVDSWLRCGAGPNFQQKGQADPEPETVINCNEMGLPQEWMY